MKIGFNLSENQARVLAYLSDNPRIGTWVSPTQIGQIVGKKPYVSASAWGSRICKRLVTLELVERNEQGWYRVK